MYPDLMVDIETTGLDPVHNAMIQIAGVRFNYETREIGPTFVGYLEVPENRFWDQGTLEWWQGQPAVLDRILNQARDAGLVWNEFVDWVADTSPNLLPNQLWAKPSHFEWAYLESYGRQFGRRPPLHYRDVVDLNSFIRGLAGTPRQGSLDKQLPMDGDAHDALDDTLHQVLVALSAKELLCSTSSPA